MKQRPSTSRAAFLTALLAVAGLLAACGGSGGSSDDAGGAPTTTTLPAPEITVNPAADTTDVALDTTVGVLAEHATITDVTVTSPKGAVKGSVKAGGKGWTSEGGLVPTTNYKVQVSYTDAAGRPGQKVAQFTTAAPEQELHTNVNVKEGGVYGVGMPVIVRLNTSVDDAHKPAVEQHLEMTTKPGIEGAWRWFSDKELHWRPATYWPAGTKASLNVDFKGVDAGDGVWGVDGRTINFAIGDAHVTLVDAATHQMTVTNNGATVKVIPVSTGKDKYPTKSGIHVVNERQHKVIMDSATVGIPRDSPEGYYETVFWNVRISNSGEFVHAAPWSVGDQGNANVSHGCVNASTPNAKWFFNFSRVGDVVKVINTSEQLQPWNGYGDWQIPWEQWKA